jgi:ATP-dependent RNA helicase SUPV3L1/SUV3
LLIRLAKRAACSAGRFGLDRLSKPQREQLRKLGVKVGALDLFMPAMLKPAPLIAWRTLLGARHAALPTPVPSMPPVLPPGKSQTPPGYRRLGKQSVRLDMAEKLLRAAHEARVAGGRQGPS